MNWFFTIITILWTIVFVLVFVLFSDSLLPDSFTIEIRKKNNNLSCENPLKPQEQESEKITSQNIPPTDDQVILLDKNSLPAELKIQKESELPDTEEELQKVITHKMQAAFENRLISILIRVDEDACVECTRDDKKIILQLKMMRALLEGNTDLALEYSKDLKEYLKKDQ